MSASSNGDFNFYMGKGELLTGTQPMDWVNKHRQRVTLFSKTPVSPGEDGTVLQADSTTNTGLRWVPHEPIAISLSNSVNSIIEFLKSLVEERVTTEARRLSTQQKIIIKNPYEAGRLYTIPFISTNTVQSVIDYLNKTFLFSLLNKCSQFQLIFEGKPLEPERILAHINIQDESVLQILIHQSGGNYKTRTNKKNKKMKVRRRKTIHK